MLVQEEEIHMISCNRDFGMEDISVYLKGKVVFLERKRFGWNLRKAEGRYIISSLGVYLQPSPHDSPTFLSSTKPQLQPIFPLPHPIPLPPSPHIHHLFHRTIQFKYHNQQCQICHIRMYMDMFKKTKLCIKNWS